MKTSETQPLEETTPVVPETAATAAQEDDRSQSRTTASGPAPTLTRDDDRPTDDEPSERHYPPAPAGSAGHP
jgi:hypothetical protein